MPVVGGQFFHNCRSFFVLAGIFGTKMIDDYGIYSVILNALCIVSHRDFIFCYHAKCHRYEFFLQTCSSQGYV